MTTLKHLDFEFEVKNHILKEEIQVYPKLEKFMKIAKDMSEVSNFNNFRVGAVLTIKGKVIAKGFNSSKGHTMQYKYNQNRTDMGENSQHPMHAEMAVLKKTKHMDLKNAELYIFNINNSGEQKLARPCGACMEAIKERGITTIHYSTNNGFATEYIDPNKKILIRKAKNPV